MAWRNGSFTWPTNPTWTANATYGYELAIATGLSLTSSSNPVLDVLVSTTSTKNVLEAAWSHILKAETTSTAGQIKFYSDSNALTDLNGATILVTGF